MAKVNPYESANSESPSHDNAFLMEGVKLVASVALVDAGVIASAWLFAKANATVSVSDVLLVFLQSPWLYVLLFLSSATLSGLANTEQQLEAKRWFKASIMIFAEALLIGAVSKI